MNNYNFFNDEWYKNTMRNSCDDLNSRNILFPNMNGNKMDIPNMTSLFTPEEGYNKGNLFANLYDQYKNYNPRPLKAVSEKERLLLELSRIKFAAHELNLYLDIYPDDNSMLTLFNDYRNRANELKKQYESLYGPLTISSNSLENSPFMWVENSWPWEGNKYV